MDPRAIQAALRAGIESRATKVGPFLVLIHSESDNPFRNYAVPVDGATPTEDDVAALIKYFVGKDRLPRLEYVRPSPAVDDALDAAAFGVAGTLALMAPQGDLVDEPAIPGYRVALVSDVRELRRAVAVQNTAFGEPEQEPDPGGLVRTIEDGGRVALVVATATGEPVGAGLSSEPRGGLVEIAGVGVVPAHRRRGVGALVTWALTAEALRRGHEPFLQVEKDEPFRVYQRIGYRMVGEMADARRPQDIDRTVPILRAGERETLLTFLNYVREGLINKLAGVTTRDARRSLVPSGTSLLWLVKHTMVVEFFWLHHLFSGRPEAEIPDGELVDADTPNSLIKRYHAIGRASADIVNDHPDLDELGVYGPPQRSLRWTLVHLIEETARHAGHADILREQIDGTVGR
jgi:GNAT superfamily N-acetyltransferase